MKHIKVVRKKSGAVFYYFRRKDNTFARLPDCGPGNPEFDRAYKVESDRRKVWTHQEVIADLEPDNQTAIFNAVLRAWKLAKKRDAQIELTVNDLMEALKLNDFRCALTGIPFDLYGRKRSPYLLSLDRIDPSIGYRRGNVRLVLLCVNVALNEWGEEVYFATAAAALSKRFANGV